MGQLEYYLIKEVSLGNDGSISMKNLKTVLTMILQIIMKLVSEVFSFIKKSSDAKFKDLNLQMTIKNL